MPFVEVENLRVCYGKTVAVQDISFAIPQGEVFGFIGPNGAGKTTTIKVLATLLKPDAGVTRIDGTDVTANPRRIRHIMGYMPDNIGVYEDLTVKEYLHFFAAAHRIGLDRRLTVVNDVLKLTDLEGKRDARVDELSRGMQQRLSLGRVLLHDPQFLLLDEPASGLDPRARIEIREILKELRGMGKTILISSHILHELAQFCTRIGIVETGRMVAQGSLDEIYRTLELTRTIHVQISNLTDELLEKIRQINGVASVTAEIDRLAVQLREEQLPVEGLAEQLWLLGARLYMFQPQAMDMETVFMKLTQGKTA
ncbi:MAG: multidrug ABC transporter ATP-binding protein [Lentisphaerae bacterium RIFOXYB12_FULL_65_16]|nr:MAG: multidrug ABC transporter ATP-binding protein [Lentisphaerae bacterium RIFOXYA12_64_32]OGV87838.1 MAG: multidrug ABC transporter ATP-binding protein [Lentisphaerae bacterium RIFOXYB12_FULL_65_16]